jgi:hydroxyacylglutathione hydrolase
MSQTKLKENQTEKAGSPEKTIELRPGVYQIPSEKFGSHVYLIRGSNKNVLVDTGMTSNFPQLARCLKQLGLQIQDIHLVLLTHEHCDHIGASTFFFETAMIGAHRLAANKIQLQDEFVTVMRYLDGSTIPFYAHLWLEDAALINLGNYQLRVIHTPGHTSGCICIYEQKEKFLFSGDTVFAKGTLSDIEVSGNISDYVNSLERLSSLKIVELYPGHGQISLTPEQDMAQALSRAKTLLEDSKMLFEAITAKKPGAPSLHRIYKDKLNAP